MNIASLFPIFLLLPACSAYDASPSPSQGCWRPAQSQPVDSSGNTAVPSSEDATGCLIEHCGVLDSCDDLQAVSQQRQSENPHAGSYVCVTEENPPGKGTYICPVDCCY